VNFTRARSFAYKTKTSFQRDFERADKPDERDIFVGTILRLAEQLGVETPLTREIAEMMERRKPWAEK
jgi:ketopantoate reductase